MNTEEMLLQILENQKEFQKDVKEQFSTVNNRLDKIENDLDEIKEDLSAAKFTASHNGEILEQMVKDLAPLNLLSMKY